MADPVQLSSHTQVQITQLFEDKRPVLAPPLNGQARPGLPPPDHHAASAESPRHGRQGSATSTKSMDSKAKAAFLSPEQAMKQFMSKLSTFEHHEVFNYPEGEFPSRPRRRCRREPPPQPLSPQCTLWVRTPRSGWG